MSDEHRFHEDRLVGAGGFEPPESEDPTPAPEKQSAQRPLVDEEFKKDMDLREIEFPDWEFITKAVELLQPYATPEEDDSFKLTGTDDRGHYSARELDAFREAFARRGEALDSLSIRVYGRNELGFFMCNAHLYEDGPRSGRAEFVGADETLVNGLAARFERLANAATARRAKREAEESPRKTKEEAALRAKQIAAREALNETAPAARTPPDSPLDVRRPKPKVWNHPWIVGTGTVVIGGLILAGIVWLISTR